MSFCLVTVRIMQQMENVAMILIYSMLMSALWLSQLSGSANRKYIFFIFIIIKFTLSLPAKDYSNYKKYFHPSHCGTLDWLCSVSGGNQKHEHV